MSHEAYQHVNSQWPEVVPELTGPEAVAAAKRLYRLAMGRPFKGTFKIVSGNRYTWVRNGVFSVNPARTGSGLETGWRDLVHMISHLCHQRLHPTWKPHGPEHHALERRLVAYVIEQGWLDGKLKKEPKPKVDPIVIRHKRVLQGIKRWTTKLKRAQTALKKLERQRRYYERKAA